MPGKSRVLHQYLFGLLGLVLVLTLTLSAQVPQGPTTIRQSVHHDVSLPLTEMVKNAPAPVLARREVEPMKRIPLPPGLSRLQEDPVRQALDLPTTPSPAVGLSFEGLGQGQYGFTVNSAPPDTNGAVGATQYVQWVNQSFAVFDKATGAKLLGPVSGNTLWSGFGGGCQTNNNGDPVAIYDKLANRWVMSQFSVSTTPYLQCVAVSQTSDATGAWYRYSFSYGNTNFDDYPKMGVWSDAYYETFNMFQNGQTFIGSDACAYDRNKMLAGQAATQICFQQSSAVGGLLPADLDGTTPPPTGAPNYMLYFGSNTLNLYKFHVDFVTPSNSTFTGPTVINVAAFSPLCSGGTCVVQPGTTQRLDSLADRLMYRLAYRNFGTHESLVVNHSVVAGTSGGVRWYEIQNPSGTPVVAQQSTYAPDATYRWMGSVAMDQAGDLAVGFSKASTSVYPSIAYAGRLATDPVSTLQAETAVVSGTGSQTSGLSRWGDYSAMTVDPVDDCTFWYTQEYMKTTGSFNWNTRIANFKFANCGSLVILTPTSLAFGNQLVGTSSTSQAVTLTNNQTSSLTGIAVSTTGDFAQTNNCGTSLAVNSSCTINVTFHPTVAGARTGTVTVNDSAGTQTSNLSGTGLAPVSLTPSSWNFGNQGLNTTSAAKAFTLANNQASALASIAVSITGTNASDYAQSNNCGTSLAANSSCTINVTFTPSAYGARTATLSVTDSVGTQTSSLTGTGKDVTPPTTQITTPANGAQLTGTVTVTATASDNVGVTSIQIYIDGVLKSSGTSSPLNYSWNTATATNGSHTIYSKAYDAAGNVGTSTTITVTTSNASTQLIQNGGFENGNLTSWSATGVYLPFVTTGHAHTGTYSAQLGASSGAEPNGNSSVYQTITIPSTAVSATLTFFYWGASTDTITYDWQEAQVQNSSGALLAQIMKICTNTKTWTKVTYNLLPYKGQTVRIYFNTHQDGYGDLTYMYLDDVTVTVQ
ncbi:MAG TPA: choice-of-anchor D domain-containing protein [Terriglobales bacterium]